MGTEGLMSWSGLGIGMLLPPLFPSSMQRLIMG